MIDSVVDILQSGQQHLLVTHESPDGDALGTTLALAKALKTLNKQVTLICVDEIPQPFKFLPGIEWFHRDCILGNFDVITVIDCGDLKRTGIPDRIRAFAQGRHQIINIDHHQRNDLHKVATINYVNYESSSAAELTLPLIQRLGVSVDKDIATCLLTGLYNDTGGFKHSNTSPLVLRQAAELMVAGARLRHIRQHVSSYKSIASLKLWGVALSRIIYHERLGLVVSIITQKDIENCGAVSEDLAGCVNLLNSIPNSNAAILLVELSNGRIKASVRTEKENIDVAALAQLFGGGGIRKAAGFSVEGRCIQVADGWLIAQGMSHSSLPFSLPKAELVAA
jgi:phosphoesterase RecJ-like protein